MIEKEQITRMCKSDRKDIDSGIRLITSYEQAIMDKQNETNERLEDIYAALCAISASLMIDQVKEEDKGELTKFVADIWKGMKPVETET